MERKYGETDCVHISHAEFPICRRSAKHLKPVPVKFRRVPELEAFHPSIEEQYVRATGKADKGRFCWPACLKGAYSYVRPCEWCWKALIVPTNKSNLWIPILGPSRSLLEKQFLCRFLSLRKIVGLYMWHWNVGAAEICLKHSRICL